MPITNNFIYIYTNRHKSLQHGLAGKTQPVATSKCLYAQNRYICCQYTKHINNHSCFHVARLLIGTVITRVLRQKTESGNGECVWSLETGERREVDSWHRHTSSGGLWLCDSVISGRPIAYTGPGGQCLVDTDRGGWAVPGFPLSYLLTPTVCVFIIRARTTQGQASLY